MKRIALGAVYGVSIIVAFAAGAHLARKNSMKSVDAALYETQAMLWFNHLHQFQEIERDLAKGCEKEALEKTRIAIDGEMKLLSSFHTDHPNSSINKYISDRDPKLLDDLETFKSKYGDSWKVPKCAE